MDSFVVDDGGVRLEGLRAGPASSTALVFHSGTPNSAVLLPGVVDAAARHGLATLSFARPGYEGSAVRRGRTVADNAALTAAVLDAQGFGSCFSLGWSGGGPHALADAALLEDRCRAAATIAGVAPYVNDFDWMAGMGEENVHEFSLAAEGEAALVPFLEEFAGGLRGIGADDVAASLGDLVSDVDKAALTGEFAELMADALRRAVSSGTDGWRDDDLAFVQPWGFEPAAIGVPVAIWQGGEDRMVPPAHGDWLAAHIPTARPRLHPEHGHLSLIAAVDEIVDDLVTLAD